ncbi:MAG: folylpolyglutamate synthase/dihydrofolate synthase family protein [Rikenellaceae bacterium]
MDYSQTLDFLYNSLPQFQRIGAAAYKAGLETTLALDKHFGSPHKAYKTVHIAGTNGKGSTSQMIYESLRAEGYSVGLYTSPHLVSFRERIVVDNQMISESGVVDFVAQNRGIIEELKPSFFEMTVAMAFWWFKKCGVDYAVVEVGMGGRLDSTNIVTPEVSVITNISKDHTQFLGDTLEKIAGEKAGIIKRGVPVVVGQSDERYDSVFIEKASFLNSYLTFADKEPSIRFDSAMSGLCQRYNAQTAYIAMGQLGISEAAKRIGIQRARVRGRWETLEENPLVICDTGHNEDGLRLVGEQLLKTQRERGAKIYFVLGVVSDKDLESVLPLLPSVAYYLFTEADIPRAMAAAELQTRAQKGGLSGELCSNVPLAVKRAKELAQHPSDIIFIGGSTFTVADALPLFE